MNQSEQSPTSFLFSLRGRLLFLICLATLPALLLTFFVARNERAAAVARTEQDAVHLARLASREHAHQIRGARALLEWLGSRLAAEGLQSPIVTDPSFLPALLAGHPQLANIGVLSADGDPLTSAFPLKNRQSWRDNPAFLAALQSDTVETGTYTISPIFERPTLNHAFAVRDARHQVIAVLFNGLDLAWLAEVARQAETPKDLSFYIADREGHVLASGSSSHAGSPALGDSRLAEFSRASNSETDFVKGTDASGVVRYVVTVPLDEMPGLLVAVSLPYEKVVAGANTVFYRTLAGLGILTLLNVVAAFIAAEVGILRSVRSLAHVARQFGAGDLTARADVPRGHNEFASLVTEFNTMADTVAVRHREALDAQARLRALASRLQVARETEATRISRELHDEIGQLLTSLKIDLSRLQSICPLGEPEKECSAALRESTVAMNLQIDAAVGFVRRISAELRPGVLDKLGLIAALEWQSSEIQKRTGLDIIVESDVDDGSLGELLSVTLFRIAQEALTNVVRHAQARSVEIGLAISDGDIVLTVHDDGAGITAGAVESSESLGIIGMFERTMLISGQLSIEGAPGHGTTVTVTAPLTPANEVVDENTAR
jgi:signal transduction histidine kinase